MSDSLLDIFKYRKRGQRDSVRHNERVKRAIKENLKELISDNSIITSDGKKKIKIPMRYLDSYRFKHTHNPNQEGVGNSNNSNKPGDVIADDGSGKESGSQAGDDSGEEIYEQEVEVEELINIMLEDLGLPWLQKKEKQSEVETENVVFNDISEVGSFSNVDRKRTIMENFKRNAKLKKPGIGNINNSDLRFKVWDVEKQIKSNAAVYCMMDRSGSMTEEHRYIAKSFFWWLVNFCRTKYQNVELVFIAHTTVARVVEEENFFKISSSGGTRCSSAFELAVKHIEEHHDPSVYNNYVFEISDGDNYKEDSKKCVRAVQKLVKMCSAVGYGEIDIDSVFKRAWGRKKEDMLSATLNADISSKNFVSSVITKKEDVYATLKELLQIEE